MREEFLHYLWRYKKIQLNNLQTVEKEPIVIEDFGQYNQNSGPDFFNARIRIAEQLWAGNVEIHIKSSDWYIHNHEQDRAYDNVILHVVWEYDTPILRKTNHAIPTLELQQFVAKQDLDNYHRLFSNSQTWINCEDDFPKTDSFLINNWLERLYFERLEAKSETIKVFLEESKHDWEAVLFKMLTKNFGLKVNSDSFLSLASSVPFSVIRKLRADALQLEALFLGQAGILEVESEDGYFLQLKREYAFISRKFELSHAGVTPVQYFRLRPSNFPTIRLSQLANLLHKEPNLFSKIIQLYTLDDFYALFSVSTSSYWDDHFMFGTPSRKTKKRLTKNFINLLLLNTIIPFKFAHAQYMDQQKDDMLLALIQSIPSEANSIIEKFDSLKKVSVSALQSQGLLQLKRRYCDTNKCLQCAIGNALLNRK